MNALVEEIRAMNRTDKQRKADDRARFAQQLKKNVRHHRKQGEYDLAVWVKGVYFVAYGPTLAVAKLRVRRKIDAVRRAITPRGRR